MGKCNSGRCCLAAGPRLRLKSVMRPTPTCLRLAVLLVFAGATARAHAPATDMLNAANSFLGALSPEQKKQATYPLTDPERENWNFVPIARQGLPFKQMKPPQRDLAIALLRSGLSQHGFARAEAIMSMELVLRELETAAAKPDKRGAVAERRDPAGYFVTIFGPPAGDKSWGWRFEGHHLSFNFTLVDGRYVFFAPAFIGSNPAEVRSGPRQGERVLGEEEDLGRALIKSLDAAQRTIAVFDAKAPKDIVTGNKKRVEPLAPAGISSAQLTNAQRSQLLALVKLYANRNRAELADAKIAEIASAGLDRMTFAWAGGMERGDPHYYRIQGPTFLVEFDNTQNGANHIHTTFRDFQGDFGHDLLREHYAKEHGR